MPTRPGIDAYHHLDAPVPHHERARILLATHPEVRALIGREPRTAAWAVALFVAQCALAAAAAHLPWWAGLALAWFVGAFLVQGLWVMIHEAGHALVFRGRVANHLLAIFANLPMVVPSGIAFVRYHDRHHAHRGVYALDADMADHWEARLIGRSAVGKALWMLFFWFFHSLRIRRLAREGGIAVFEPWTVANVVASVGFDALVLWLWGPGALLYLFASLAFGIGLHPLGARWVQEHFVVAEGQETYSYYGPANRLTFDVGYHVEHHDLPSVPWSRLRALRAAAPELYDGLHAHTSWTRLWLRFLFDPSLTLYSRVSRPERPTTAEAAAG